MILALVYYECPMLCTLTLNGLVSALKAVSFDVGNQFNVVTVSFKPSETPQLAAAKKQTYLKSYGRAGADAGWHFLTGDEANIKRLTEAVGFRYRWVPEQNQFAHAAGITVLTPSGKIARYFFGVEYSPRDLRLGLVEAAAEHIGSPVDQLLLYCFHYDPATGKYGAVVMNIVRLGGAAHGAHPWRGTGHHVAAGPRAPCSRRGQQVSHAVQSATVPAAGIHGRQDVDALFYFLIGVSAFFAVLIAVLLIFFAVRYRRRSATDRPHAIEGALQLELLWTIIPFGLTMIMFVWSASIYREAAAATGQRHAGVRRRQAVDVEAAAHRGAARDQRAARAGGPSGEAHHDVGGRDSQLLRPGLPHQAGRACRGATRRRGSRRRTPGTYHLFCAEYCGTQHSGMIGSVIVMEPAEFATWLSGGVKQSLASAGENLFQQLGCSSCHVDDAKGRGPVLTGLFGKQVQLNNGATVVADETYVRESILNPQAKIVAGYQPIMPTFKGLVSEEQLLQLIAYIKEKGAGSGERSGGREPRERGA